MEADHGAKRHLVTARERQRPALVKASALAELAMLDEEEALAAVERAAREAEVAAISRQIEELTQRRAAVIEPASWWSSNRAPVIATRRAALRQQLG